ncbi:minor tail protein [Mycobacterium phage Tiger]|uniref:Minor tail protein n=1 Tax=Mycobacterium phage Tiger TaxID=1161934 RepID=H9NCU0_9CAUD|nr:minor tail protein [Mycobacterium phage Tiger]ATW60000.1 hypothetical protein SEA_PHLORENCE_26 [Mycobacterium phage Phlorence]ATW60972.1 hypothetical protein SEA_ARAGOG_26 [Mycobacterium phage Aragog]ATW61214.1 hypothetical protein SEA_AGENTM_26 [Mycobacterium phage AgentM]WNM67842.1 hypothetical protein SEA_DISCOKNOWIUM_26 [Mycobacterium phage Discoknowium]AFF28411.1 hypothetical protein TIGER_26 [Mycobacterium phage Tiger]
MSDADTVPLDAEEIKQAVAPWSRQIGWDANGDGEIDEIEEKVPEPLVLRSLIVAIVGLAGAVLGKELDVSWIDQAIAAYAVGAPMVLAFWARRHVSPVKK